MATQVRELTSTDEALLLAAANGVFDHAVDAAATRAFLADPNHRIVAAIDDNIVVGFASAVITLHPDRASPECWINQVSVAPSHRDRGLGKELMQAILGVARDAGATEAWVLTHRVNRFASRLYESVGGKQEPDASVMYTFIL